MALRPLAWRVLAISLVGDGHDGEACIDLPAADDGGGGGDSAGPALASTGAPNLGPALELAWPDTGATVSRLVVRQALFA